MKYYVLINIIIYLLNTNTEIMLGARGTAIGTVTPFHFLSSVKKWKANKKREVCAGEIANGIRVFAERIYKK